MKKSTRMPPSSLHIGNNCIVDEGAILGQTSGRKHLSLRPLVLGHHARIRSGAVIYINTTIGNHFETGHGAIIREDNRIGDGVCIWNHTTIDYGCCIGDRVKIHCNVYVAQYTTIEDDVFIAPGVTITNDLFPKARYAEKMLQGPVIKRGAVIGGHCTILPGVVIGAGALIGAGSVVTHNVPPDSVAWGNPAIVRKTLGDLYWPKQFPVRNPSAQRFYRRRLAGRRAFPKSK